MHAVNAKILHYDNCTDNCTVQKTFSLNVVTHQGYDRVQSYEWQIQQNIEFITVMLIIFLVIIIKLIHMRFSPLTSSAIHDHIGIKTPPDPGHNTFQPPHFPQLPQEIAYLMRNENIKNVQ